MYFGVKARTVISPGFAAENRRTALHCAALSDVEVSGVEVSGAPYCDALSGVEVSEAEMPRRCPERSRGVEQYA